MGTLIIIGILFGIVGSMILSKKGRSGVGGFALGFFLGPIGVIIALVMSSNEEEQKEIAVQTGQSGEYRKCPYCAEAIRKEAKVCRYCQRELQAVLPAYHQQREPEAALLTDHQRRNAAVASHKFVQGKCEWCGAKGAYVNQYVVMCQKRPV